MALPNAARGEAALRIDGTPRILCLTLGALARLETAFAATGPGAMAERLRAPSAGDLLVILAALLGEDDPDALARARIDPAEAAAAIALAFARAIPEQARP